MATFGALLCISGLSTPARADLRPDKIHVADTKKTQAYLSDGLVAGGDRAVDEVTVKDIRRAANLGFERIVFDLEVGRGGQALGVPRAPYFQAAVSPDEKRLTLTIWGNPKLDFDARRVMASFKKAALVQQVMIFPRMGDKSWTVTFELKGDFPVEVFELTNPVRIILDVKDARRAHAGKG